MKLFMRRSNYVFYSYLIKHYRDYLAGSVTEAGILFNIPQILFLGMLSRYSSSNIHKQGITFHLSEVDKWLVVKSIVLSHQVICRVG